jgi:hypothetical protein
MIDSEISRVRLRDLARLGPRAAGPRPEDGDLSKSII